MDHRGLCRLWIKPIVLFCVWSLLSTPRQHVSGQLPDFSTDHHVEDYVSVSEHVESVYSMRDSNDDMPDHCRYDVCAEEFYVSDRQGNFTWPRTIVGFRQHVRCPYAVVRPLYAYRECRLGYNENGTLVPLWGNMSLDHCPGTPLSEALKLAKAASQMFRSREFDESFFQKHFGGALSLIQTYFDQPIYRDNVDDLFSLAKSALERGVQAGHVTPLTPLKVTFKVIEWLIETDQEQFDGRQLDRQSTLWMLSVMSAMLDPPPGDNSVTLAGESAVMTTFITMDTYISDVTLSTSGPHAAMETAIAISTNLAGEKVVRVLHLPLQDYFKEYYMYSSLLEDISMEVMELEVPIVYVTTATTVDNWRQQSLRHRLASNIPANVTFTLSHGENIDGYRKCGNAELTTITNPEEFTLSVWNGSRCSMLASADNRTSCLCRGSGYFGVLTPMQMLMSSNFFPSHDDVVVVEEEKSSIAVFLGFPYQYELYVTSHVFRAISLVCLILTVTSYAIQRQKRRGTPTKILLNLCASLIALLVVLYIAEGISHTTRGCRFSNLIRYYLILVTLLWNGVEGVNMYLMLVKVFNKEIRHFTLKAAAVAWGLPILPIAIILIVDKKGFDGVYTDDCVFRCQLKPPVLYYGYLIPLGLILLFNITVFVRVLLVLRKNRGNVGASKGKERSHWMRLLGAVSIMVLLGIPWIFSAFGAIDAADTSAALQTTEAVFHVVFVVCVNLQGVFIFVFHCARNAEIRSQWRETITRTRSTSAGTSTQRRSSDSSLSKSRRRSSHGNSVYADRGSKSSELGALLRKLDRKRPTSQSTVNDSMTDSYNVTASQSVMSESMLRNSLLSESVPKNSGFSESVEKSDNSVIDDSSKVDLLSENGRQTDQKPVAKTTTPPKNTSV